MIKKILLLLIISPINLFALPGSPMDTWYYPEPITLNGKTFNTFSKNEDPKSGRTLADSYREQMGYALRMGDSDCFWLYDTITYHGGKAKDIYDLFIPRWVEKMGYVIDFDRNYVEYIPHVESSVESLMKQRGCDTAVYFYPGLYLYHPKDPHPYKGGQVEIIEYLNSKNIYKRTLYRLVK